jgi:hypothetical protein
MCTSIPTRSDLTEQQRLLQDLPYTAVRSSKFHLHKEYANQGTFKLKMLRNGFGTMISSIKAIAGHPNTVARMWQAYVCRDQTLYVEGGCCCSIQLLWVDLVAWGRNQH